METPPVQLLQKARVVFSLLGSFSSGMFGSVRAPIVFVEQERRKSDATRFAAHLLGATMAEIYPSNPLEKQNRANIRRALTDASRKMEFAEARRRYTSCRGRTRAMELYDRLMRD